MRFNFCIRFGLLALEDETYLQRLSEAPSFFKKPQSQFTKMARSVVLGGIPLSTCVFFVATLVHGAFSPWLLLVAVPYLMFGAGLSYAISEPNKSPKWKILPSILDITNETRSPAPRP